MTLPLVSICIPAYNAESYILETVQSALDQTYKNIEIIIVDDGSLDNTGTIIDGILNDKVSTYRQKNAGAAAARNLAYKHSKGDYIKFLDGDDLVNPQMVESQVKLACENENCIVSAAWGRFYNNCISTFKLSPEDCWHDLPPVKWLCRSWKNGTSMTQAGIFLLPRNTIEEAGLWDEQLSLIDDLDFFTRAILKSKKMIFCPDAILYYRSGNGGTLSDQKTSRSVLSAFTAIDKATRALLLTEDNDETKLACANIWQHFIYDTYPHHTNLLAVAQKRVIELGGSSLKFQSGGLTRALVKLVGWRLAKRIKQII